MFEISKSMRERKTPHGDQYSELRQDLNAPARLSSATYSAEQARLERIFPSASRRQLNIRQPSCRAGNCACALIFSCPWRSAFVLALSRRGLRLLPCSDRPAMPLGYHHSLAHFHTHTATVPALYAVAMLMLRICFPIPDRLVRRLQ